MNIDGIRGYSAALDALPADVIDRMSDAVFCHRNGVLSVTIVTYFAEDILSLAGQLPDGMLNGGTRFGIDLESIGTEAVRIYVDRLNRGIAGEGYIIKNGAVNQHKLYRRQEAGKLLIDRSENGVVISENEKEVVCTEADWTGPSSLIDAVKAAGYHAIFLKKTDKPQTYLRVR